MKLLRNFLLLIIIAAVISIFVMYNLHQKTATKQSTISEHDSSLLKKEWLAPDTNSIPKTAEGDLIRYGRDLIANTSYYLGPKGKVATISNGMNCQNCHLDAGARSFSNCFSAVASIYPVFRPRSGIVESIEFRVNDCMQRSLNGKPMDSASKEMQAMVAYFHWLDKDVKKGVKPVGAGTEDLPFLDRAADPVRGKQVYITNCQSCHGINGQGVFKPDSSGYVYPPLWGMHSYNVGAGLYRLTKFAGYVKASMPFGIATHNKPVLSDADAWDVAAFVNSQPRPVKSFPKDWPDLSLKSIDYPFGPYTDSFSEKEHKYGPYGPIKKARENAKKKT